MKVCEIDTSIKSQNLVIVNKERDEVYRGDYEHIPKKWLEKEVFFISDIEPFFLTIICE
ncbi:MAG: hypothetical protein MJZ37_08150 [Bacilli bacterium]|nr:hypothetical protein [Bacilli bacterium]